MVLKVLGICGSLRRGSYNRKLLAVVKGLATNAGALVNELDLKELNLPIYDGDIEAAGLPEAVKTLKATIEAIDVIFIATPEYNRSIPGGLKNAIDWASRQGESFNGKIGALFGSSNGPFGTVRAQNHLRDVLMARGMYFLPNPFGLVANEEAAFTPEGNLVDEKINAWMKQLVEKTLDFAEKLKS